MLFQRVALQISLVLLACSFASAKSELRNNTLCVDENKEVTKDGFVKVMGYLCSQNDYDETNAESNLPIRRAARFGHTLLVEKLMSNYNVDPAANDNQAIQRSSLIGHSEVVKCLLKHEKVDPSADDNYAIQFVSNYGYSQVAQHLLKQKRVDPSADDNEAIIWASRDGHLEVVKCLLKHDKVDPSANNNEAIQLASNFGHSEVVKHLLKHEKVDPSANNDYAIRWASENGHFEVVNLLLNDSRVDPAVNDNYPIQCASKTGRIEVVQLLLNDKRVDPRGDDNGAIRCASTNGHLEVVQLLLNDSRVDPSGRNNEAIRWASLNGHTKVVKLLLKDGRVDPSADDNYAIRRASLNGHSEIVKLLLNDSRVDPTVFDNSAIRDASEYGHIEVVKLLLKDTRVDPTAKDNEAIRLASKNEAIQSVSKHENVRTKSKFSLKEKRFDPRAKYGHAAVVELLLTNSSVDATKALKIAIDKKYYGIVSIINKARPKLFNNDEVLKLAKKTIQVKTTISVENSKLIVNYESEYDYDATFVLTSLNETIYLNVENISNGKLPIEMNKLSENNEWNWRWICAFQSIENIGKFQISPTSITMKDNVIYWDNSNLIGFDLPAKITYNSLVLEEIDSIMDKNNVTLDLDKMTVIETKEYDLLFECWGTKIIISTKINSKVGDVSNFLDSNNSTIPDVSIGSKLPIWIIVVIVISAVVIIAVVITVYLCIRSRRRQRNLARLRAFGNGKLHIFHIGPVETIGKQRRR